MITGELKSRIDRVWDAFWSGGISNPIEVIEQITYLLFIRCLDDLQTLAEKKANWIGEPVEGPSFLPGQEELRWSRFKNQDPTVMYQVVSAAVFPFLQRLGGDGSTYSHHMKDARFTIPTPALLSRVVDMLDDVPMTDRDTNGDLYESMPGKIARSPPRSSYDASTRPCWIERPDIRYRDSLSEDASLDEEKYTLILANPPFAGSLDCESTSNELQKVVRTKKTELLFLALFLKLLKPGGRAAVIVPDGVLLGSNKLRATPTTSGSTTSVPTGTRWTTSATRSRPTTSPTPSPAGGTAPRWSRRAVKAQLETEIQQGLAELREMLS